MPHRLTQNQITLFSRLAQLELDSKLFHPIRPVPITADEYVIYLRDSENLRFRNYGDLDALCVVGLMDYQLTRMGNTKQFSINRAGLRLYESGELTTERDFERADLIAESTTHLKTALSYLLAGEALSRALTEITFVRGQLLINQPNPPRIQTSVRRLGEMVFARFHTVPLRQANEAVAALGEWCETINQFLTVFSVESQPISVE